MEQIIQKFSAKLISQMNGIYIRSENENIRLKYGIELIIHNICTITLVIITAVCANTLRDTMIMFFVFGTLRFMAGGMHLDTSIQCYLATSMVVVGGAKVSQMSQLNSNMILIIFLAFIWIAYQYAPSGTRNNPITPRLKRKLKVRTICLLMVYFVISYVNLAHLREMITVASACEMITILPFSNRKYKE